MRVKASEELLKMVVTQLPFLVIANADSTLWSEISPAPILSEIPTLMLTKYLPTLNLSLTHFFSFLCILPADIFIFGSIVGASGVGRYIAWNPVLAGYLSMSL